VVIGAIFESMPKIIRMQNKGPVMRVMSNLSMIAGVDGTAYPQYRQQLAAWRKRHAAHTSNHHTFIGHNL
jgi:hypothetical protein